MGQERQEKGDIPTRAPSGAALFRLNYFLKLVVPFLKKTPKTVGMFVRLFVLRFYIFSRNRSSRFAFVLTKQISLLGQVQSSSIG